MHLGLVKGEIGGSEEGKRGKIGNRESRTRIESAESDTPQTRFNPYSGVLYPSNCKIWVYIPQNFKENQIELLALVKGIYPRFCVWRAEFDCQESVNN